MITTMESSTFYDMSSLYKNTITGQVVELVAIDTFPYYPVLVRDVSTDIERRYEIQYFKDNFRKIPKN